jgi:Zn-dependent protease with chaperone function
MEMNERTDLATLAKTVKKKVNGLMGVYSLLILLTIILFLVVTVVVALILWGLYVSDALYTRLLVYGLLVIGAAGYCLIVVLKPLFKIFKRPKAKGWEVFRDDHPELFTLIDEVVSKVDCLQPRHVRVSDECNAYVFHSSLLGYLFTGRQNLTIGLPLIYGMNKTELKSILSHEFGHFTQKSVQTNRTANLSEFICASIARAIDEAEQSENSTAKLARGYVRFAGKVMAKQYHKIAPYNGLLSRAQEFDADHYSQLVAGTDGSVSALCKLDRISDRWSDFYSFLYSYQVNEKRSPDAVFPSYESFFIGMDGRTHETITPGVHLSQPISRVESRIGSADRADTHPSTEERVKALRSYPELETVWDNSPAMEYFDDKLVNETFSAIPWEIKQAIDPGATVFDRKKDISPEEITKILEGGTPPYLDWFGQYRLFLLPQDPDVDEPDSLPIQGSDPFSEENSAILERFYTAEDDLITLESVAEEKSPETKFCYLGHLYDGTNVPLEEHKAYFNPLKEKATSIARRCNKWLDDKAKELGEESLLYAYRVAALADLTLQPLNDAMRTVYAIGQAKDNREGARNYVASVEKEFKERTKELMRVDNDSSVFDYIASVLGIETDAITQVKSYFAGAKTGIDDICQAFVTAGSSSHSFSRMAWDRIKREFILGQKTNSGNGS